MKTAAVDKSACCGDTPALLPGNSRPHSSAKTPFVSGLGKKRRGEGDRDSRGDAEEKSNRFLQTSTNK